MAKRKARTTGKRTPRRASRASRQELAKLDRWFLHREVWGLVLIALGVVTFISLVAPHQGRLGELWSLLLRRAFGLGAYIVALFLVAGGSLLLSRESIRRALLSRWQAIVGLELAFFAWLGLIHVVSSEPSLILAQQGRRGGYIGWALSQLLVPLLGKTLSILLLLLLTLLGVYLTLGVPWPVLWWRLRWLWAKVGIWLRARFLAQRSSSFSESHRLAPKPSLHSRPRAKVERKRPAPIPKRKRTSAKAEPALAKKALAVKPTRRRTSGKLPPLDLLLPDEGQGGDDADARHRAQIIEETLEAFGIPARVVEWHRGPVVTQFGVEPGYIERQDREGNLRRYKIRVSKILSLTNDLALALAASPIRIEAPVPGRAIVGIEVPNTKKSLVGLRGVLESPQFRKKRSKLRIALGRDVSGEPVVADLATMPHLLIAGATGSGKSVCLNAIIASLLFQNTPQELKLLLIDPKRVELSKYNGIPHLLAPIVTDVEKVIVALRWLTREMERRYRLFAQVGARNIAVYNRLAKKKGEETLPWIVVIIDELADLMLAAPEDVERTICRLAQMARATGIHLVIATQRPSVDVVTGLIKANFPARISFAVTSQVDSRVILDSPGAEKLLGRGDMLFMAPDSSKLQRIQGCFVSDKELEALAAFWRAKATEEGEATPGPAPWEGMSFEETGADDALIQRAIEVVRQRRQASASFLQRRLRIGYPRAARLIDQLEEMGIVGPPEGGGRSRRVLISEEDDLSTLQGTET